jgi:hypothetical protein
VATETARVFDLEADLLTERNLPEGIRGFASDSGRSYVFTSGAWVQVASQWFVRTGVPDFDLGQEDDFYFDQTAGNVYQKVVSATRTVTNKIAETGSVVSDDGSDSVTTIATLTPVPGRLYVATVQYSATSPTIDSLEGGGGLVWEEVKTLSWQMSTKRTSVFVALQTSGLTSGPLTFTLTADSAQTFRYLIHVDEITNAPVVEGLNGTNAILQSESNSAASGTSLSVTLGGFTTSVNTTFGAFGHGANEATTPGSGFTELADTPNSGVALETEWKDGEDLAPSASWATSTASGGIALEVALDLTIPVWTEVGTFLTDSAGIFVGEGAFTQSTPSNPTGTTDTTGKMMGLAGSITPKGTRIIVVISGTQDNDTNTNGRGVKAKIRYGTGTAPTNGAALTGTAVGNEPQNVNVNSVHPRTGFTCNAVITGLTADTTYWLDLGVAAIVAGTGTVYDISISALDF